MALFKPSGPRALCLSAILASPTAIAAPFLELFTSHGCFSCPPADALLEQLQEADPDLVAVEWHVDYWDDLVYGGSNWVDPYSDPAWSARQRAYNQLGLAGQPGVYTPQAVIDGRIGVVGSDARAVSASLDAVAGRQAAMLEWQDDLLNVSIPEGGQLEADVWLLWVDPEQRTRITAGENQGKTLRNRNVVRELIRVMSVSELNAGKPLVIERDRESAQRCAVVLQQRGDGGLPGPVMDAVWCN